MPRSLDLPKALARLRRFYLRQRRLPSYSEIQHLFHYRSKAPVSNLVSHLVDKGILRKDPAGKLIPTPQLEGGVKLLGVVEAGFPSPAEEELIDTLSLDDFMIRNREASFLVRVKGDSMIEAGICPGDLVIVERGREPRNGDIVIARLEGENEWTMKYFFKQGRQAILKAANPKYPPIRPKRELEIGAVVTGLLRKYVK